MTAFYLFQSCRPALYYVENVLSRGAYIKFAAMFWFLAGLASLPLQPEIFNLPL